MLEKSANNIDGPASIGGKNTTKARKKLTLFWRVSGLILGLLFFATFIPTVLTIRSSDRLLRQNLADHGKTIAATVASATSNLVANEDTTSLQAILFTLAQGDSLMAGARICDRTGTVVCYSREEERGTTIASLLSPPAQPEMKEVARHGGPTLLQVTTPLFKYGDPWGSFQFELSLAHVDDEISATIERSLWTGLVLLALGTAVAAWLVSSLTRPIARLAVVASEVARGNLAARSGLVSGGEIGELARTFDYMTYELAKATKETQTRSSSLEKQVTRRTQALEAKKIELEEAKKQVELASRSRNELMTGFSQEVLSPVDQIIGMADVALDTHLSPEQRQYVTFAKESAQGLKAMLKDGGELLSRLEQGGSDSVLIGFQLRDVVGDLLSLFASRAHEKGLELIGQVAPDVPDALVGNPDRVRQILLNLVGNAIKFTREGEVVLKVEQEPRTATNVCVHFIVKDTGQGVAREKEAVVREALAANKSADVGKPNGAALGLTITSQLAETVGGEIWFESTEGKGSTFHFKAGFRVQQGASRASDNRRAARLANRHALVVAASASFRNAVEETLRGWGMNVSGADGPHAVASLEQAREQGRLPDVVLLDSRVAPADHHALWKAAEASSGLFGALVLFIAGGEPGSEAAWWSSVTRFVSVEKPVKESDLLEAMLESVRALEESAAR